MVVSSRDVAEVLRSGSRMSRQSWVVMGVSLARGAAWGVGGAEERRESGGARGARFND
ncbi:hypothetical protein FHS28_004459 [Roseateles terrae]|uniref:ESPR domain-containing protein n=1 Tax=Roseateles terrae TaxID=431060 RepID=A0ABR6GYB1_9BURK|nr:hypothetical protein [Roseateles terrae]